jgi:preprotein translocase subunit SecE
VTEVSTTGESSPASRPNDGSSSGGFIGGWIQAAVRFVREIVAELRKVIWPARQELVTYTIVVVIFVVIMVAMVGGLDLGFAHFTLWLFG